MDCFSMNKLQTRSILEIIGCENHHLSSWVTIVVFVLVPHSKLFWERLLDHLIGHLLTYTLGNDNKSFTVDASLEILKASFKFVQKSSPI